MKKISLIVAMISILLFSCDNMVGDLMEEFSRGNIICVNQNASGKQTGRGWKDAYTDLQFAIGIAKDGDEIWIAGDYDSGSVQITINKNIKIVGGFDENDQLKGDRPDNSRSKVYGGMATGANNAFIEIDSADVIFENLDLNNTSNDGRTVYIYSNAEVTIKNCVFNNNSDSSDTGGAIRVYQAGLNIIDSDFEDTTGLSNSTNGGVIESVSSKLNISGSTFSNIMASSNGGAVYIFGGQANITGCEFNGNTAVHNGGAIYTESSDVLNISNCTFNTNESNGSGANYGGGVIYSSYSTIYFSNNTIKNNKAAQNGGAIFSLGRSFEIIDCVFENNIAEGNSGTSGGGSIFVKLDCTLNISSSIFSGTTGIINADYGGAILATSQCNVILSKNCIFKSNTSSQQGGAIYMSGCGYNISDSKFISNVSNSGGSIFCSGGLMNGLNYISNCVFDNNQTDSNGGAININITGNIELNILSSNFYNNISVSGSGGALFISNSPINVSDSRFFSNSASGVKNHFDGNLANLYLYNTYVD